MTVLDVLTELRAGSYLMHDRFERTVTLYDGNPAAGSPRGSLRVDLAVFVELIESKRICRSQTGIQERYELCGVGKVALTGVDS
jgi:hypothetical protein